MTRCFNTIPVIDLSLRKDYLVTTSWLKDNLSKDKLIILDSRGNRDEYLKGHIKGARLISWQELSNVENSPITNNEWGMLKNKEDIEKVLKESGIENDSFVVVYTDSLESYGEEARILWSLKVAGLKNVRVLNGGIEKWKKDSGDIYKEPILPNKGSFSIDKLKVDINISTKDLSENLNKYSVIDSRELEEYNGEKTYGEARKGHIPKSKHIFYKNFYNKDGTFVSEKFIAKLLFENNVDVDEIIVPYCTAGVRSALIWMMLTIYGYKVKNYDASFAGWANNPILPVDR